MTQHYVYLFHTKEFVDSKEPVYKIGKSTLPNIERIRQYEDDESFHFEIPCNNCHDLEKKIIALFNINYELHYGREYFKGNRHRMVKDICRFILEEDEPVILFEEIAQYWFDEVVVNDDEIVENNVVVENDDVDVPSSTIIDATTRTPYFCTPCGYPCRSRSNLTKHNLSKKHKNKIENPDAIIDGDFKCLNCPKTYKGIQGLWYHKKVCKAIPVPVAIPDAVQQEPDLCEEINNLKVIIIEMIKRQQPATI
jgi:hypothetical protein